MAKKPGGSGGAPPPPPSKPNGGSATAPAATYTDSRSKWSVDLLKALGYPVTPDNVRFLNAWQQAEGTRASYNPLATTQQWNGATSFNSVGVRNYASYQDGLQATVKTLRNGYYGGILSALQKGSSAVAAAQAVAASPWGTGKGVLNVLGGGGGGAGNSDALLGKGGTNGGSGGSNPETSLGASDLDDFQLSKSMIRAVPELWNLWQKAVSQDWDPSRFGIALKNTSWYKNHSSAQRSALYLEKTDPAEFAKQLDERVLSIKQMAGEAGATLSADQIEKIAKRALVGGWDDAQLKATLSHYIVYTSGSLAGSAGETEDYLRQYAADMGVRAGDNWILKQAQGLFAGTTSMETAKDHLDRLALSSFPGLKDQIAAGMTVRDIASPYLQGMSSILEMNPDSVDLFDPTIRKALTSVDAKGKPVLTPLWQFENQIKQDPRWLKTNNARDDLMSTTRNLLQSWGLSI